jgi:hypothetical protein
MLQLQRAVNSFVKGAINLNLKNLRDVQAEPDKDKRVRLTAMMRANMSDLAGVTRPSIEAQEEIESKNIVVNLQPVKVIHGG